MADYFIRQGDTLSGIAARMQTSVESLLRANPSIINPDLIRSGDTLVVPSTVPTVDSNSALILEAMKKSNDAIIELGATDINAPGDACAGCTPNRQSGPSVLKQSLLYKKSSVLDLSSEVKPEDATEFGKSFKEKVGMELSESIRLYKESTGENLEPGTVETLFTTTMSANHTLIYDEKLHRTYRDILNSQVPATEKDAKKLGYIKLSEAKSKYHDPANNWKYVSQDGHREAVYNKRTGNLVTSDEFKGTFNFFGPDDWWGHFANDVHPYWKHGN